MQHLKMKVDHLTFETVWIKGKDNVKADALSRHPCAQASAEDELDEEVFTAQKQMLYYISRKHIHRQKLLYGRMDPLKHHSTLYAPQTRTSLTIG
jgi:hypothetical protein